MAFNRRGTLLASGTKEGQVVIWDFDTRGVAAVLEGHNAAVTSVSWSRNGRQLLSGSEDASIILWDVQQGKQVTRLQLGSAVLRVSLHPRGPPFPALAALAEGPPVLIDLAAVTVAAGNAPGEAGRAAVEPLPLVPEAADAAPAPAGRGRGANADGSGAGPGAAASGGLAVFSKSGDVVIGGQMRGALTVVDTASRRILDIVRLPNSARVTDLVLNRKGDLLLATCGDQRVRLFELAPPAAAAPRQSAAATAAAAGAAAAGAGASGSSAPGAAAGEGEGGSSKGDHGGKAGSTPPPPAPAAPLAPPTDAQLTEAVSNKSIKSGSLLHGEAGLLRHVRDFQNAVERTPWRTAAFSADSEHVVGATAAKSQLLLYIWNRPLGNMERILEGPKEGVMQLAWHPLRSLLLSCAGTGRIYIWAKVHAENWSAFAPDFKELDENTEYVEREDEFDWNTPGAGGELGLPMGAAAAASGGEEGGEGAAGADVDVFTREPLHYFSSDDEEEQPAVANGGGHEAWAPAAAHDELLYLPVVIERELVPAAGRSEAGGEGEEDGGEEEEEEAGGLQGGGDGGAEASLAAGRLAQFPRRGGGAGGSNGVAAARGAAGEEQGEDEEMRDAGGEDGGEEGAAGGTGGAAGGGAGGGGGRKRKVQFDEGTLGR
ncbi:hypothetical protein HYH02_012627 [Chlamydomonas schloesseri]|uniref:Anaphase-promoting complex subunit 4 WD40 domain-containing protein n=1 Tax=Chlamydomonas schloesseri TaxID=2026947 RepID=A0A835SUM7_9CHLO|nr:hypothetical protein HYH02_012627 [Chlamydomonas schloesseri]|eukprot:KAG2433509.1 hypothetical protein HYH02_012627 [Chlamydomonas schloesseri]